MVKDNIPLILVHYGDPDYLETTLTNAVRMNPDKRVILIGDESNNKYTSKGIEHFLFKDYICSKFEIELNSCYRLIGGSEFQEINRKKGGKDWTKFNFLKWNVLYEFCKQNRISTFWTFDSDVLYCKPLSSVEENYKSFDYTTIGNSLHVMQGLINNIQWLRVYNQITLEVFRDDELISLLKRTDFSDNPSYGLTMMRVFEIMKNTHNPLTFDLSNLKNDIYYDACICIPYNNEVTYMKMMNKRKVKKLFFNHTGNFYEQNKSNGEFYEIFAINMSWVPNYFIHRVDRIISGRNSTSHIGLKLVSQHLPLKLKLKLFLLKFPQKIKYEYNKLRSKN